MKDIILGDGKYTITSRDDVHIYAKRYNCEWRDLTGDNLFYLLIQRIQELENSSINQSTTNEENTYEGVRPHTQFT